MLLQIPHYFFQDPVGDWQVPAGLGAKVPQDKNIRVCGVMKKAFMLRVTKSGLCWIPPGKKESGFRGVTARPDETPWPPCGCACRIDKPASRWAARIRTFVDGKSRVWGVFFQEKYTKCVKNVKYKSKVSSLSTWNKTHCSVITDDYFCEKSKFLSTSCWGSSLESVITSK